MIVEPTLLDGVHRLHLTSSADARGTFIRTHDAALLRDAGLAWRDERSSISRNLRAGTLRGLHLQASPAQENKVVRCARGQIFDVVADLRPTSPTFGQWQGFSLDEEEFVALYVPSGCAHGFETLADDCEVSYVIDAPYEPHLATGVRFDDPTLDISWPMDPIVISERDRTLPTFEEAVRRA